MGKRVIEIYRCGIRGERLPEPYVIIPFVRKMINCICEYSSWPMRVRIFSCVKVFLLSFAPELGLLSSSWYISGKNRLTGITLLPTARKRVDVPKRRRMDGCSKSLPLCGCFQV